MTDHPSHLELSLNRITWGKLGNVTPHLSQPEEWPKTAEVASTVPRFAGAVYDPALDDARLTRQLGRVFEAIRGGEWLTLQDIADATGDPHASISAQLRHLRKARFGSHLVEKRRRTATCGTWEYRLRPQDTGEDA